MVKVVINNMKAKLKTRFFDLYILLLLMCVHNIAKP